MDIKHLTNIPHFVLHVLATGKCLPVQARTSSSRKLPVSASRTDTFQEELVFASRQSLAGLLHQKSFRSSEAFYNSHLHPHLYDCLRLCSPGENPTFHSTQAVRLPDKHRTFSHLPDECIQAGLPCCEVPFRSRYYKYDNP